MSESERTPGYRNKSHVPPIAPRPSRITKLFSGHFRRRWHAAPIPESPAPTTSTSTCSIQCPPEKHFHAKESFAQSPPTEFYIDSLRIWLMLSELSVKRFGPGADGCGEDTVR